MFRFIRGKKQRITTRICMSIKEILCREYNFGIVIILAIIVRSKKGLGLNIMSFIFGWWGVPWITSAVLWGLPLALSQKLILAGSVYHVGYWGLNLGWPLPRQTTSPLCYRSSTNIVRFLILLTMTKNSLVRFIIQNKMPLGL